jgi:hypothetical protein
VGARRSFLFAIKNDPANLKRDVDRSAKKREQQYNLFKHHGTSPLSHHTSENSKKFTSPAQSQKNVTTYIADNTLLHQQHL